MTEGSPSFGVNAKRKPMSALVLCQFTVQFSYHFGPRFHTMDARPSENVTERPIWLYIFLFSVIVLFCYGSGVSE